MALNSRWRRPRYLVSAAVAAVVIGVIGGWLFQPWLLFVDRRVDEQTPGSAAGSGEFPAGDGSPAPRPSTSSRTPGAPPVAISTGTLISHEHQTSGRVVVLAQPDGQRTLRIENLDTSNGPDLRVWLSAGPVVEGRRGWFVFADHPHVELGRLKGNQGSHNYAIPAAVDLGKFTSLTIWCKRFSVSFGAARLTPT